MSYRMIYITTKDRDEARKIAKAVIEERLAACANIIDGMQSMYWWQGQIAEEQEAVLIFKTKQTQVANLQRRVKELHSYTTPCILSYEVKEGLPEYLQWIDAETSR